MNSWTWLIGANYHQYAQHFGASFKRSNCTLHINWHTKYIHFCIICVLLLLGDCVSFRLGGWVGLCTRGGKLEVLDVCDGIRQTLTEKCPLRAHSRLVPLRTIDAGQSRKDRIRSRPVGG